MNRERLHNLYLQLLRAYGQQGWWPGDDDPLEVVVGSVLTQRCSWRNAESALANLKAAGLLSINGLLNTAEEHIAEVIRPAGFYRSKAKTLKAVAERVTREHAGVLSRFLSQPMETLRVELLSIRGIGEETADAICLYAAGQPSFVIDAYTRRLLVRLGWITGGESYAELRSHFMERLPADVAMFNEYHALIVRHGKDRCRTRPVCDGCSLGGICRFPDDGSPRRVL